MTALVSHQFNSATISQRSEDGYLNATAMCKAARRFWGNYWQNETTKAYVSELSGSIGIPIDQLICVIRKGPNANRGTWVHPKIAIHLAQWLSPKFAVWCTNVIHDWIAGKATAETKAIAPAPQPTVKVPPFFDGLRELPEAHSLAEKRMWSANGHLKLAKANLEELGYVMLEGGVEFREAYDNLKITISAALHAVERGRELIEDERSQEPVYLAG